ncbi:MAG: class I SAM-dependent methyltransferase [Chloroflexi bacterium]|nr:class I SAM-dependent methyltransferase [Chloroflexota bacterium]
MIKFMKRILPASLRHSLHRARIRATDRVQLFFWYRSRSNGFPVPPVDLRTRVGSSSIESYLTQGQRHVYDLQHALGVIGQEFASFQAILEFGCGSGRQTRWLPQLTRNRAAIYGTDLDVPSVAWLQTTFPFGNFSVNGPQPPLPYLDERFDLILAVSVFTHLTETGQLSWLSELRRVTRPGGVLLLTTHGPHALAKHLQESADQRPRWPCSVGNPWFLWLFGISRDRPIYIGLLTKLNPARRESS